jgi:hypothetical protein
MSSLAVPLRPDNIRGRFGELVEADVFHICARVKEVDPNLYIYVVDKPGELEKRFSIVELCRDGEERLVFRTNVLDGRIIEKLQYLLRVPFKTRFAEAEALEAKAEEERQRLEHEDLYERIGRPMLTDLDRCGFIPGGRRSSYAKRGVTGGRGSLRSTT